MMMPDYLVQGEPARLIPVISDNRREQRAASVLLAVFSMVPDFANAVLTGIGHRIGKRAIINTFTEVVLAKDEEGKKDRPDGLIEIHSGKRVWKALVEAKIGSATLNQDQVERYLKLARVNKLDAVITISNEFATRPEHHPLQISKTLTRSVQLYHLSWTALFTEASILHSNSSIDDPEQAYLMRELVRFMSDDSVGVTGYTAMPSEWKDLVEMVQAGAKLSQRGPDVYSAVCGWHQEIRDLSLLLGRLIGMQVGVRLTKAEAANSEVRIKNDIGALCRKNKLNARLQIPGAASDLLVEADLKSRSIRASMIVNAPQDKKRTSARLGWLLRQMKEVSIEGVNIHTIWPSRAADSMFSLDALRRDQSIVSNGSEGAAPRAFEVVLSSDSGRRFGGRKTFIEDVEAVVPLFYDKIGQILKSWQPSAPRPTISTNKETPELSENVEQTTVVQPKPGNDYVEMLDIPHFLQRF